MATLRRILKYMPAVVMGLLVVAWVVSLFVSAGVTVNSSGLTFVAFTLPSRFQFMWGSSEAPSGLGATLIQPNYSLAWLLGRFDFIADARSPFRNPDEYYSALAVPLPLLVTLLLPLAIGPFISFRFRLWHYLAFTTLVAVELAYYLRWQE